MKFTDYSATTTVSKDGVFLIDGAGGTKKITATNAAASLLNMIPAEAHRNIFRGKNLGSSVSDAQKTAITSGTFDDLFVGDYWTINGIVYRIADMDYFYNCGDANFNRHHLVIVPDSSMGNAVMNANGKTDGGYTGSEMYTTNLKTAKDKIKKDFNGSVLSHKDYLVNAVSGGHASGGAWFDSEVELMNEIMVYGTTIFTPANNGTTIPALYTTGNSQLALFRLNPKMIKTRYDYWLRDVVSAPYFAFVSAYGYAIYATASNSFGVRPEFVIG